jgi:Tfp pilus assembly protein PilF
MLEPEDDPEYWSTMGYSLLMQGKIDQAQKYYEKALQLEPDNEGALNNLGSILSRQGNMDEGFRYLLYATNLYPDSANGWINLASSYVEKGQVHEAMECYKRAKMLDPGSLSCGIIVDVPSDGRIGSEKQYQTMNSL